MNVTVVLFSFNDDDQIADAISSAKLLTDQVILMDMESTDDTQRIAQEAGIPVYTVPFTPYVEPNRKLGIGKVRTEWALILDADERLTPKLASEIKKADESYSFFKIPRKELFGKKVWLRHGGWWPNYQTRLIKKSAFISWPDAIHSTPQIQGAGGLLTEPMLHFSKNDYSMIVAKTTVFENIESDLLHKAGRKTSTLIFFRKFLGELWRRMGRNMAFLDGKIGIIEAIYQAYSKTITYLYLYEKSRSL